MGLKRASGLLPAIITEAFLGVMGGLITVITSFVAERKFKISRRLKRLYYRLKNEDAGVKFHFIYEPEQEFQQALETFKEQFKEDYGDIKVFRDSEQTYEASLGEEITITITDSGENLTIYTQRKDSTMRKLESDIETFNETLRNGANKEGGEFKEFTVELFLPYHEQFVKIDIPVDFDDSKIELKTRHQNYESVVSLEAESVSIHSEDLVNLERLISNFV